MLYELFDEVELTEEMKDNMLTKYFGKPLLQGEKEHVSRQSFLCSVRILYTAVLVCEYKSYLLLVRGLFINFA